jgi:aminomethyltransferase
MPIAEGGEVTSGTLSPFLGQAVGMGYVGAGHAEPETPITIDLRGRPRRARVVRKPFYKREDQ